MKSKWLYVLIFIYLSSLLGNGDGAKKYGGRYRSTKKSPREKHKFEKLTATTLVPKRSSCLAPGDLAETLRENIDNIRDNLSIEMELRLQELTELIENVLQEQTSCYNEKEKEIRESIECKKPSTTSTPMPLSTTTSAMTSGHGTRRPPLMCDSNNCKTLASRMLDMIDHSADPCQDFYQYACGGVEDDLHLSPEDPKLDANRRLKEKIECLNKKNAIMGPARVFYDACLEWEEDPDSDESLQFAKERVRSVGWFLPDDSMKLRNFTGSLPEPTNLTKMLATFMLSDFTPFFDVSLEPDASQKDTFLPKISLSLRNEHLSKEIDHLTCISEFDKKIENSSYEGRSPLDLEQEYQQYQLCKNKEGLNAKLSRMEKAIKEMKLLDYLDEKDQVKLLVAIRQETEILLVDIGEKLRNKRALKSTVLNKHYQVNYLKDIDNLLGNQINWQEFFKILTGETLKPDQRLVIYHQKELAEILTIIGNEWKLNARGIHNSLLMLWSENVYSTMISPLEPPENYCLQATKILLPDISSALYLHSFSDVHLARAQRKIKTKVNTIKKTFASMFSEKEDIRRKIDSVEINVGNFFDDVSQREQSLMDSIKGMNLTSSHVNNMDVLLKRLRHLMYNLFGQPTNSPKAMWVTGILPFKKEGFHVHETNHMFLPFGAFAPPYYYFRQNLPEYIFFGGLGHLVAEQFIRMIDGTDGGRKHGVHLYGRDIFNNPGPVIGHADSHCGKAGAIAQQLTSQHEGKEFDGESKSPLDIPYNLIHFTECIIDQLTPGFTIDSKVQATYKTSDVHFKLNDVFTFSGGTSLSWKAYMASQHDYESHSLSLIESPEDPLIWMGENPLKPIKAYFLRVAQTHCSRSSKIDLLDIMENESMMPRQKVNLIFKNNDLFSEAFQCPRDSSMNLGYKCSFMTHDGGERRVPGN